MKLISEVQIGKWIILMILKDYIYIKLVQKIRNIFYVLKNFIFYLFVILLFFYLNNFIDKIF